MAALAAPGDAEVHVWRAPLDVDAATLGALAQALSPDEREREQRLRAPRDRDRFAAARGWLRRLLGAYLGTDPAALRFAEGAHGKPRLAPGFPAWLRFSVTHSAGLAAYAVARGREVGADVERIREDLDIDAVARRFFSARERDELGSLPAPQRLRASFDCWTRKEAYLKGVGAGLLLPLEDFDVAVRALGPSRITAREPFGAAWRDWTVHPLAVGAGYAGAVAVEGGAVSVPATAQSLPERLAAAARGT